MLNKIAREILAPVHLHNNLHLLSYGMDFGKRLKQLMEDKSIKPKALADMMDVDTSYISQLRSSHRNPGRETLIKLSRALNLTMDDFVTSSNIERANVPEGCIPVISLVQAGKWNEAIDSYPPGVSDEWIQYETKNKGVFALKVKGTSMEPEYRDGDLIIVNPQTEAHVGDDVIAKYGDQVTFKRLKIYKPGEMVMLSPLNPVGHKDMLVTGRDLKGFRIIGVYEALMRKKQGRR